MALIPKTWSLKRGTSSTSLAADFFLDQLSMLHSVGIYEDYNISPYVFEGPLYNMGHQPTSAALVCHCGENLKTEEVVAKFCGVVILSKVETGVTTQGQAVAQGRILGEGQKWCVF
jgi:hypothetical protein